MLPRRNTPILGVAEVIFQDEGMLPRFRVIVCFPFWTLIEAKRWIFGNSTVWSNFVPKRLLRDGQALSVLSQLSLTLSGDTTFYSLLFLVCFVLVSFSDR
jgi:hypothetical protein